MTIELQFGVKWGDSAIWGRVYYEQGKVYIERTNVNRTFNDSLRN